MAEGKNKIIVYKDWINVFDKLTDEEAGKLIKHFFQYVNDMNPEAPDRLTEIVFEPIKQTLKRDLEKWEEKSTENSLSGRIGNLKRWGNLDLYEAVINNKMTIENAEQIAKNRKTSPPDNSREKTSQNIAVNDSVSVSVTVNDSVNDILLEKETKEEKILKKNFDFKASLISIGVSETVALDWMEVRRKKKASNTETAFKIIATEINKTGRSPNECITEAVARSWQGFKAEWITNTNNNGNTAETKSNDLGAQADRIARGIFGSDSFGVTTGSNESTEDVDYESVNG